MQFISEIIDRALNNRVLYEKTLALLARFEFGRDLFLNVNGLKMYASTPDRFIASFLWKFAILERYETCLLKQLLKPGMRIVDIGANIGYYTLMMAAWVGNTGEVIAFEPDPENYRLLTKNIHQNHMKNINPVQKAVSSQSGTARLFLNRGHRGDHRIFDDRGHRPSLAIETAALDDVLADKPVDLIKMDIQGAEMLALQGMRTVIQNNPGILIITEFSPHLLHRCGTRPADYLAEIDSAGLGIELINEQAGRLEPIDHTVLLDRCTGTRYENLLLRRPAAGPPRP